MAKHSRTSHDSRLTFIEFAHLGEAIAVFVGLKHGVGRTVSLLRASDVSVASQVGSSSPSLAFSETDSLPEHLRRQHPLHSRSLPCKSLYIAPNDETVQSQRPQVPESWLKENALVYLRWVASCGSSMGHRLYRWHLCQLLRTQLHTSVCDRTVS